jgi:hypothetical protein
MERADPGMKLKRLEKQLDGEEGQPGLREQLLVSVQMLENQKRLVARRETQREEIDELALDKFDANLAEVRMYEIFYEGQTEEIVLQIEELEGEIEKLKSAGIPSVAPKGNRQTRRR